MSRGVRLAGGHWLPSTGSSEFFLHTDSAAAYGPVHDAVRRLTRSVAREPGDVEDESHHVVIGRRHPGPVPAFRSATKKLWRTATALTALSGTLVE